MGLRNRLCPRDNARPRARERRHPTSSTSTSRTIAQPPPAARVARKRPVSCEQRAARVLQSSRPSRSGGNARTPESRSSSDIPGAEARFRSADRTSKRVRRGKEGLASPRPAPIGWQAGCTPNDLTTTAPCRAPRHACGRVRRRGRETRSSHDLGNAKRSVRVSDHAHDADDPASPGRDARQAPRASEAGRGAADGIALARQVDVQLRRRVGLVRFRELALHQPEGAGVDENLSDQWFEGYVKPALSATYTLASSSEIYGKVSAVGERTYGSVPAAFGEDVSSFGPEDLSIGWRSGKALTMGENALDFVIGRTQYQLGHGLSALGRCGRGRHPRRVLDQRAQGLRVCGHRPLSAGTAQGRGLLPRQGRAPGERQRQPSVGHQLRVQRRREHDVRRHLHEVVRRCRDRSGPRRAERVQPARLHRSSQEHARSVV